MRKKKPESLSPSAVKTPPKATAARVPIEDPFFSGFEDGAMVPSCSGKGEEDKSTVTIVRITRISQKEEKKPRVLESSATRRKEIGIVAVSAVSSFATAKGRREGENVRIYIYIFKASVFQEACSRREKEQI